MLEIVNNLNNKIKDSLDNTNLSLINSKLEKINSPTLLCGVGGSLVVSTFLSKVLEKKNNIITKHIDVEEYFLNDFSNYLNLILVSYSGTNHGITSIIDKEKKTYLLTSKKNKTSSEILLNYEIINREKSFIALDDTFIPLSIILSYYLGNTDIYKYIPKKEDFSCILKKNINIICDSDSKACANFLESSLIESGVSNVNLHTKYSLCHGRTNCISAFDNLVIYLKTKDTPLDKILIEEINKISNNFLLLQSNYNDSVIDDYVLCFKALYFLEYLNRVYKKEFVNVKYNSITPTLYDFKGEFR